MNLCPNVVELKMFSIHSMKLATFQLIKIRLKKKVALLVSYESKPSLSQK